MPSGKCLFFLVALIFFLFPECVLKGSCVLGRRSGGGALFAARCVFAAFKCVLPCL